MTTCTVVTGGSSGLGLAFARAAAAAGERVVDVSRSGPPADLDVAHVAADLSDPASWDLVVAAVAAEVARLQDGDRVVVLHAAGTIEPLGHAGEVPRAPQDAAVQLSLAAPVALGDRLLGLLAPRTGLRRQLCLIGSGAATSVYPGWSVYAAGKAAAAQWVRTVGAEQEQRGGVEVSWVAPGVLDTPMQDVVRSVDAASNAHVERFRELHAEGGLTPPADAAARLRELLDRGAGHGAVLDLRDL